MASPSEAFKWILFPGSRRRCRECGKEPLKIADVGEHRRLYPGGIDEFWCKNCQRRHVDRMIEENRRALGLQETRPDQRP